MYIVLVQVCNITMYTYMYYSTHLHVHIHCTCTCRLYVHTLRIKFSIFTKFFSVCSNSDAMWCLAKSALFPVVTDGTPVNVDETLVAKFESFFGPSDLRPVHKN